jgi:dTDP-4-amino-4,6-dideoxygalactose transaminase
MWQLERYDQIREKRNRNARILTDSLGHLSWDVGANANPAYLKLRLVVDPADAPSAMSQCRQHGIAAANSNWPRLIEASDSQSRVHAYRAATFGIEIPVHQNLSPTHIAQIASAFAGARSPARLDDDRPATIDVEDV